LKCQQKISVRAVTKTKKSFNGSCDCTGSPLELARLSSVNLFLAVYQSNHFNFTRRLKPCWYWESIYAWKRKFKTKRPCKNHPLFTSRKYRARMSTQKRF